MFRTACLVALLASAATTAYAAAITDPAGDFLPSFVDARTPDRDVVAASAKLNGLNPEPISPTQSANSRVGIWPPG